MSFSFRREQLAEASLKKTDLTQSYTSCQLLEALGIAKHDKCTQVHFIVSGVGAGEFLHNRHHEVIKKLELATRDQALQYALIQETFDGKLGRCLGLLAEHCVLRRSTCDSSC